KITADPNGDPTNYALQLADATNNVYRSAIAPPPQAVYNELSTHTGGDYTAEYPGVDHLSDLNSAAGGTTVQDDTSVADLRAYDKAGLIITVHPDGTNTITKVVNGTSTDVTGTYASVVSQTSMYDLREAKDVPITQIDVGALKTALGTNYANYSNFN